jgi:chromosome undetermined scaffold_80, whole genome shotgun sequence
MSDGKDILSKSTNDESDLEFIEPENLFLRFLKWTYWILPIVIFLFGYFMWYDYSKRVDKIFENTPSLVTKEVEIKDADIIIKVSDLKFQANDQEGTLSIQIPPQRKKINLREFVDKRKESELLEIKSNHIDFLEKHYSVGINWVMFWLTLITVIIGIVTLLIPYFTRKWIDGVERDFTKKKQFTNNILRQVKGIKDKAKTELDSLAEATSIAKEQTKQTKLEFETLKTRIDAEINKMTNNLNKLIDAIKSANNKKSELADSQILAVKYNEINRLMLTNMFLEAKNKLLDLLKNKNSNKSYINAQLMTACYNLNEYQEAYEYSKKALKIDPNDPILHYNSGLCLIKQNLYTDAFNCLKEAIKLNPNNIVFFNLIFHICKVSNDENLKIQCEEYIKSIETLNCENIAIWNSIGNYFFDTKKYEKAKKIYSDALIVLQGQKKSKFLYNPDIRQTLYSNLGSLYCFMGNPKEALEYLNKSLGFGPISVATYLHYAHAYFLTLDYENAYKNAKRFLETEELSGVTYTGDDLIVDVITDAKSKLQNENSNPYAKKLFNILDNCIAKYKRNIMKNDSM